MNSDLLNIIIGSLLALAANVLIKLIEKHKPQEEKEKLTLEAADLAVDVAKEALEISQNEVMKLRKQVDDLSEISNKLEKIVENQGKILGKIEGVK